MQEQQEQLDAMVAIEALLATATDLRRVCDELREELRTTVQELRSLRSQAPQREHVERTTLGDGEPSSAARPLTPREREVAELISEGASNLAIARRLGISVHTARHHTESVLAKLGVRSRAAVGLRLRELDAA